MTFVITAMLNRVLRANQEQGPVDSKKKKKKKKKTEKKNQNFHAVSVVFKSFLDYITKLH